MARELTLLDLNDADRLLVETARRTSRYAYAPYSGFAVGAAVRTRIADIHVGTNLENASYGLAICGEASALTAANSAGDFDVEAIAVVGIKFIGPQDDTQIAMPCGRCRQLIYEASQVSKTDIRILACNGELSRVVEAKISESLPLAFGPTNLGIDLKWSRMRTDLQTLVDKLILR